ncbi:hypothetical protein [Halospeciosus flavus]|uniref:DUF7847 domain-containing protein n=1 Tax=Halospeciosus flavus TaxID=3032283 RepID=A0ABD5Z235_9EURY|nr:hypothetical protein [Halospeciosus flavus]
MASAGQSPANGLLLVAISYVLNVVNAATGPRTAAFPDQAPFPAGAAQPLVPVPLAVDAVLSLLVGVVGMVVTIAALRLFVGEETESLSVDLFTRNGVWALLNFVAGTIVFGIVVFVGFLLLVVPGIFLLTTLFYWPVFVAVEDENFAEALQSSWELTKGSRLRVFLLGVVFFVVAFVVSVVFGLPAVLLGPVGFLVTAVGTSFVAILGNAVLASAYLQLQAEDGSTDAGPTPVVARE